MPEGGQHCFSTMKSLWSEDGARYTTLIDIKCCKVGNEENQIQSHNQALKLDLKMLFHPKSEKRIHLFTSSCM